MSQKTWGKFLWARNKAGGSWDRVRGAGNRVREPRKLLEGTGKGPQKQEIGPGVGNRVKGQGIGSEDLGKSSKGPRKG